MTKEQRINLHILADDGITDTICALTDLMLESPPLLAVNIMTAMQQLSHLRQRISELTQPV